MQKFYLAAILPFLAATALSAPINNGYYRYPALRGDTLIFTAQGDLWKVSAKGGAAQMLTSHPGPETNTAISPDGKLAAFVATYEGAPEAYVMPVEGGLPTRLTYHGSRAEVAGWTPDGKVLYVSRAGSTLPEVRLHTVDPKTLDRTAVPLAQASDGTYDPTGKTIFFTRLPFQGSITKRYRGGTAQQIWRFTSGDKEAVALTKNYTGTSKRPMWWKGRIYFDSDRDGTMNLWSMDERGGNLKQHTKHIGFDVQSPSMDAGRIAYQLGADIHIFDIAAGTDSVVNISLTNDFDQMREKWITELPSAVSSANLSDDGTKVVLTARGRVFVAPTETGRLVQITRKNGVRYRSGLLTPDGKSVLALSDESGENEWWSFPANGVGAGKQLTTSAKVVRLNGFISPDGKRLAYTDKNQELSLLNLEDNKSTKVFASKDGPLTEVRWSPDSQWMAYVIPGAQFDRIAIYSLKSGESTIVTSARFDARGPAWSPDGKWLYFVSDRTLHSSVQSPWGARQPEPFFDKQSKIYMIALKKGLRSPFQRPDELEKVISPAPPAAKPTVSIDLDGLPKRLWEVPVPAGSYAMVNAVGSRLIFASRPSALSRSLNLMAVDVKNSDVTPHSIIDGISGYEVSHDGKKLLITKGSEFYTLDSSAASGPGKVVDLSGWTFSMIPGEEWKQLFIDAWRLERDYFYDPNMHGMDWTAIRNRFEPLVDRVRDRDELNDLIEQMVGELSALHTFVQGGDSRRGTEKATGASLGAEWTRDEAKGGYVIQRIYNGDPDYPETLAPVAYPIANLNEGDVILAINGVPTLSVADAATLLRTGVDKQTLLKVKGADGMERECVVNPISTAQFQGLRYTDWEFSRRNKVEEVSKGTMGYVHLRAMGAEDMAQFVREFYPAMDRDGLIIDVRHNQGGNIDSWVLSRLMRKAWMYWQPRVGNPYWNMHGAFRGHMVVICDEYTASDGEAFTEGFKRLRLGKVIGTRTWGGEIWLSFENFLQDGGIASAAEMGVYGPEGKWLIEGHGVDPDMVVDNLPHATFSGEDAQLNAAIAYLHEQIKQHPTPVPPAPKYPVKK